MNDKYEALRQYYWILKAYGKEIPLSHMRDIKIFRSQYTYTKDKPWGIAHKERTYIKLKSGAILRITRETQENGKYSLNSECFRITNIEEVEKNDMH